MIPLPEAVAAGVERLSLRTPTLPPATETNSYFVSHGDAFYVVEPATPHPREREVLFEAVRARAAEGRDLLGVIATHHHTDHVGCAAEIRAEFGVPLLAHAITRDRLAPRIEVDHVLRDRDPLFDGAVNVLHTPGHAPGHVCLWSPVHRWLIAGDMVASVGTIIIDPDDDGDMDAYLTQLARLEALDASVVLPAHGDPIGAPRERFGFYTAHRLERERRVLDAVHTATSLVDIVRVAYVDTPVWLWPLATKSARAHLARLERLGTVRTSDGRWTRA